MLSAVKKLLFREFRKSETKLHELNYLFWECTLRCNLDCLHCGSDCSKNSYIADMPQGDFLKALDTIKRSEKRIIVVLTGGEPLLRDDIELCGLEIRKRGMRWSLVTNGLLYNKEKHIALLNAGLGALTISLDGLEGSHNWLRNSNCSFKHVENAIGLAAGSQRLNFDVVTCVNQRNINELPEILDFLVVRGVKAWRLFTVVPIGRARGHPELFLNGYLLRDLMEFISRSRKEGKIDIKFSCEGYVGKYELKVRDSYFFCRAGINIGSILYDGSVSACPNIDRAFIQGNIYHDDFYKVWETRFDLFRNRSWTKTGSCAICSEYKDCEGNGMHNWFADTKTLLMCHNKILERDFPGRNLKMV